MPALSMLPTEDTPNIDVLCQRVTDHDLYALGIIIAATCSDNVLLTRYHKAPRNEYSLVQESLLPGESPERGAWRTMKHGFGVRMLPLTDPAWRRNILVLPAYHQNEGPRGHLDPKKRGKAQLVVHVTLPSMILNLNTEWNEVRDTNPPVEVEWVPVKSAADICAIGNTYFASMRSKDKREAELGIIALALGIEWKPVEEADAA